MRTPQAGVPDGPATVRGGAGKGPPPRGALGAVAAATLPRRSRPHSPRPLHPGSLLRAQPQPSALRIRLGPCGSGWPGCRPPPVAAQHAGACRRGRAPCASVRPRSTRPSRGGPCSRCLPWSSSCRRCVSWPALARRARASSLRPPRVVFVIGCVSCNKFSHFRQKKDKIVYFSLHIVTGNGGLWQVSEAPKYFGGGEKKMNKISPPPHSHPTPPRRSSQGEHPRITLPTYL
jgi:hypothetical protein